MGWLAGWSYAKEISLTGQTGAGTLYQVDLDIGASAGGDFHLEGHCTNFPQDIEVTDNDGTTLLDFSIEDITADPIKLWAEVADDLGSNQKVWVYYGKSGASTNSDIDATFLLGDDFPGSSIDTGKWTGNTSNAAVSGGIMSFGGDNTTTAMESILTFGPTVALRSKIKLLTPSSYITHLGFQDVGGTIEHALMYVNYTPQNIIYTRAGGTSSEVNSNWTLGSYNTIDLMLIGGSSISGFEDDVERTNSPVTSNVPNNSDMPVSFVGRAAAATSQTEWVFVRKYQAIEPAFSSAGSEESAPAGHPTMKRWGGIPGMQYTGRRSW